MPFLTNAIQIRNFYCSINNTMLWHVFAVSFHMWLNGTLQGVFTCYFQTKLFSSCVQIKNVMNVSLDKPSKTALNQCSLLFDCHTSCEQDLMAVVPCVQVYVVGGYDGQNRLSSVECYDSFSNRWTEVAPLKEAVSSPAVTSCVGKLFVIGGGPDDNTCSDKVSLLSGVPPSIHSKQHWWYKTRSCTRSAWIGFCWMECGVTLIQKYRVENGNWLIHCYRGPVVFLVDNLLTPWASQVLWILKWNCLENTVKHCVYICAYNLLCINYWCMDLHLRWLDFWGRHCCFVSPCVTCVGMPGCSFSWAFNLKGLSLFPGAVVWPWYQFLAAPCHHPHCQEMHHGRVPQQPDLRCWWAHQSHLLLWPHWGLLDACTEYIQQTGNYQSKLHRQLKGNFGHCYLSIKEVYICFALIEFSDSIPALPLCVTQNLTEEEVSKAVAFQLGVTVRQSRLCLELLMLKNNISGWWYRNYLLLHVFI